MTSRPVVLLFILVAVVIVSPALVSSGYLVSFSSSPTIIVVGDFQSELSFGSMVRPGIVQAMQDVNHANTLFVHVDESEHADIDSAMNRMREEIVRAIANHDVVAIVAANSSKTAHAITDIADDFRIPALFCVASSDTLLEGSSFSLRLLAPDSEQSNAISQWIEGILASPTVSPEEHSEAARPIVALIADDTSHGRGIARQLSAIADTGQLVLFHTGGGSDVMTSIRHGIDIGVDAWIVAAYQETARDTIAKMLTLDSQAPVLLTDGAYGPWIMRDHELDITICFPLNSTYAASGGHQRGYACRGYDAIRLVSGAVSNARSFGRPRAELIDGIRDIARNSNVDLVCSYSFSASGENAEAIFDLFRTRDGIFP